MAFAKKTWKDRITEFPTRRTLTKSDGSTELVTVARAEGTVSQEGDAFNAASMNDLENRIDQANNDLSEQLNSGLSDSIANETFNYGVKDGVRGFYTNPSRADDCFVPFSSGAAPFLIYKPERNIDGKWIQQLVLFSDNESKISLLEQTGSQTHENSTFIYYSQNRDIGTITFKKAGKYYINSYGFITDKTALNEIKVVDIIENYVLNWNNKSSKDFLVIVKVG